MNAIRITLILIGIVAAFIVAGVVAVTLVYAHDTPAIRDGSATHDWTEYGRPGDINKHWHYYVEKERSDGTIDARGRGSWEHCVVSAYNSATDEYDGLDEYGRCIEPETKDVVTPKPMLNPCVMGQPCAVGMSNPCDPMPEISTEPIPEVTKDEPISIPVLSIEYIYYVMTFPEGLNSLHLPIKGDIMYFTDLFEELGDGVNSLESLRPTVQRWTIVRSVNSVQDEWISEYRGFVANMEEETTIELVSEKRGYGYSIIYVKEGVNLIGVPRDSDSLDTVGGFYTVLDGVISVQTMVDGEMVTPDDDDPIDPTIGYFVTVTEDDEFAVWGYQWVYEMSSPAPQIVRFGKVATTWGAIKQHGK